jgi:peptidoglycan hydrolase-like protein with peptidoglycan-binding domain
MKNFLSRRFVWSSSLLSLGVAVLIVTALSTFVVNASTTFISLTSQVNIGEKSSNVTNLQLFLSADPTIYPEGLVTGYYGPLTKAAVMRFQARYGIDTVGRVGPLTLAKINILITSGGWASATDVSGPWISSVNRSVTSNGAVFSWVTNETATGRVFYHTSPITMNEGDINSVGFGSTNGLSVTNDGLSRTSQQVSVSGLQPNTTYYYVVVATDSKGNVSVWNPNTTFKTNQ